MKKKTLKQFFIGGGDLVRADDWSINTLYMKKGLSFTQILSPTNQSNHTIASLGVGVPFLIDEALGCYLKNSFARSNKMSVRDSISQKILQEHDIESEIIPDVVSIISEYFPREKLHPNFSEISNEIKKKYEIVLEKYIVFQANSNVIMKDDLGVLSAAINLLTKELNVPVVLLSIGECLGDNELYEELYPLLENSLIVNRDNFPGIRLLDKVAILANSSGFIGSSLHGNIISFSYDIPNITFCANYSNKLKGFFDLTQNEMCFNNIKGFNENIEKVITKLETRKK